MKKINIKYDKVFIYVSIIFLASLFLLYSSRFIYYYFKEKNKKSIKSVPFSEILMDRNDLENKNDSYFFAGQNKNNYVYYSGMMFRILSIKDGNIKLVLDNSITPLVMSFDDSNYDETYINEWLNKIDDKEYTGIFESYLTDKENFLVKTETCVDTIEDINASTCEEYNDNYYVGLLSIDEYYNAGSSSSYLNNGEDFWLSNKSTNGNYWSISVNGKLSDNTKSKVSYKSYGVRPTITLSKDVYLVSGDGSYENPYKIEENNNTILRNVYNGSYVSYAGYKWRMIANDKDKAKLVLVDALKEDNEYVLMTYDNIIDYLNSFYESLSNKEYILNSTWYTGSYGTEGMYDYKNIYTNSYEGYVSLPSIGDMFLFDTNDIYMITPGDEMVYTIQNYSLFGDTKENKLRIRPVIYVNNLVTVSGNGTIDNPYKIEGEV